jgi:transcriptional regulator with XRE-family HTH domain
MNFANTLKNLREVNNVTQEQLAEYLKVTRPTIAGYETKSRQPDYERLQKIADYFQVSIDYLIRGMSEEKLAPVKEKTLDQEVKIAYQNLSLESKQDVLICIRLLELRDSTKK